MSGRECSPGLHVSEPEQGNPGNDGVICDVPQGDLPVRDAAPRRRADADVLMQTFRFEVLTWNIAGTADADAYAILEKDLSSVDGFQGYIYQSEHMYRAVALLWKDDKFQLKRKLPRERGIWCLLQHKLCNSKIWVASFHLPHNQTLLECERRRRLW